MNFRKLLVSKIGYAIAFLVSAVTATVLAFLGSHAPWLHAEDLVNACGGPLVVGLLLMGTLREGLAWIQRHWTHANLESVQIIQEALNEQITLRDGQPLKEDGLLQQNTASVINQLMPKVNLPVGDIPAAKDAPKSPVIAVLVIGAACVLSSCTAMQPYANADADGYAAGVRGKWSDVAAVVPSLFAKTGDEPITEGLAK